MRRYVSILSAAIVIVAGVAATDPATAIKEPIGSGPFTFRQNEWRPGELAIFDRNPNWDASTDPIRNAYPDSWNFQLGVADPSLTQRLMAESGTDKNAVELAASSDPTQMQSLATGSTYKARTVNEYQPYVETLDINTKRITDPKVRQAIAYAFPASQVQQALGGSPQGDIGTTLLSPTMAGWKAYDPFGKTITPTGDIAKAKELLKEAGQPNPTLVFAYANTQKWSGFATTVANALESAGFKVVTKAIDSTSYYSQVGKVDNEYDIYRTGWGADWPNASTVVPPTMDGRNLADGTNNYSFLNDNYINTQIDKIEAETDLTQQAKDWEALSEYSLKTDTAQVPFLYDKFFNIYGSGLGGVTYNSVVGVINASSIYVKQ